MHAYNLLISIIKEYSVITHNGVMLAISADFSMRPHHFNHKVCF